MGDVASTFSQQVKTAETDPHNWSAAEELGKAYEPSDVDVAIASLTAILERDPDNMSAAQELGKAYGRPGWCSLTAIFERDPYNRTPAEELG